jgi:hypothetical protein
VDTGDPDAVSGWLKRVGLDRLEARGNDALHRPVALRDGRLPVMSCKWPICDGIDLAPGRFILSHSPRVLLNAPTVKISPKRRLSQIPNESTIADVGLVQPKASLCGGFAPHESYSLGGSQLLQGVHCRGLAS